MVADLVNLASAYVQPSVQLILLPRRTGSNGDSVYSIGKCFHLQSWHPETLKFSVEKLQKCDSCVVVFQELSGFCTCCESTSIVIGCCYCNLDDLKV